MSADLVGIGSGDDFLGRAKDCRTDTGTAGSGVDETVAVGSDVGSGAAIAGPDNLDGPVGSGIDSAASRAGDSATGLGMTCSGPAALASSLRDSVDDLDDVPGLARPPRAVDDRLIMVPMRDFRDFEEGDP